MTSSQRSSTRIARRRVEPAPGPEAAPRGCSSYKVRRLSRRLSNLFDAHVAATGLKTTQYSLLNHASRLGPLRPGDLARAMGLDASTLTRNLKPLVAAGWIEVGPGDDERSRTVRITDAGAAKRAEAARAWKRAQLALNETLGAERVVRLHAVVDECMAILDDAGPDDTP